MQGKRRNDAPARDARGVLDRLEDRGMAIARLAARQRGQVTRSQLLSVGLGSGAIEQRLRDGRLHRMRRGVYLVGYRRKDPYAGEMAAVLACGPNAVLSHRSAARLWGLLTAGPSPLPVDVTVVARDPGRKPGLRVHRTPALSPDEIRKHKDIPVTAPARTLLDLTVVATARELEQALAEAHARNLVRRPHLLHLVGRHRGRSGVPALRALIDDRPALTRSEAEERLLALIREAELPAPEVNVGLGPYIVDFLWRDRRLAVEVDGFVAHSSRKAFERDRRRDADLAAQGYTVVRVTWRQIVDAPAATLARIAEALASRWA